MIIIAPFAQKLRFDKEGKENPKNYPYWNELLPLLRTVDENIVQVGTQNDKKIVDDFRTLNLDELKELTLQCDSWIAVDSFFQHFAWDVGKYGIVLWGQSDPNIFGHPENINLLKDRKYLREKQFWWWEQCDYIADAFVEPEVVITALRKQLNK